MENSAISIEEHAWESALSEIRNALPPENYGWQKAVENGITDVSVHADPLKNKQRLTFALDARLPDGGRSFDCTSGSVTAIDILRHHGISDARLGSISLKDSGFLFKNDHVVWRPDGTVIRVAPLYPLIDRILPEWNIMDVTISPEEHEELVGGRRYFTVAAGARLPLSIVSVKDEKVLIEMQFIQSTSQWVKFFYGGKKSIGDGRIESMKVTLKMPKFLSYEHAEPDLIALLDYGLSAHKAHHIVSVYHTERKAANTVLPYQYEGFVFDRLPDFWQEALSPGFPAVGRFIRDTMRSLSTEQFQG